ncbi:hypothetical protein ACFV2N_02480 [Streptomyces sp. NPDC059680]|uniref:hypothetical protein n=1 Tax=Streptomyces sp. NPDC059680 TaxID=3346904 RepID=UPI0036C9CE59
MAAGRRAVLAAMAGGLLAGCTGPKSGGGDSATSSSGPAGADSGAAPPPTPGTPPSATASTTRPPVTRAEIVARYGRSEPHTWGFDARAWCSPCLARPATSR